MAPEEMVQWGGYQTGEPTGMASSLESCLCFYDAIDAKESTLLDAGAGASTWIFRKLLKNVTSTDPDQNYLRIVESIVGGESYVAGIENCQTHDYVYWDYGHGNSIRTQLMDIGLSKCKIAMYVDDCHDHEINSYMQSLASRNNCNVIYPKSLDTFGRFGAIVKRQTHQFIANM